MNKIPNMVNMARTSDEKEPSVIPDQPTYPYGLNISLGEQELEKLGFSQGELQVGDMVHLHSLAAVTSVSSHDNVNSGPSCRVELELRYIQAESEDDENDEVDQKPIKRQNIASKLYTAV